MYYLWGNKNSNDSGFSSDTTESRRKSHMFPVLKLNNRQEFHTQQKYPSEIKRKARYSQVMKTKNWPPEDLPLKKR